MVTYLRQERQVVPDENKALLQELMRWGVLREEPQEVPQTKRGEVEREDKESLDNYFPESLVRKWTQPLTKEEYKMLDENSRCFKKWKELGALPLDQIVANSPHDLQIYKHN
jgi:hypothetical protein